MRVPKWFFLKVVFVCGIFFLTGQSFSESTLLSIRKGGEGNKSWAVFSFDEKVRWIGVSQFDTGVSIYFYGLPGDMDESNLSMDPVSNGKIVVKRVSDNPAMFRADIICDPDIALAVMKKNRNIVVAFNDERLLTGKITNEDDVAFTPGQFVGIKPDVQGDFVTTEIGFAGSFDWVGYIRSSRENVLLIVRGISYAGDGIAYAINNSPLQSIQLSSVDTDIPSLKASLFFDTLPSYSIVLKRDHLLVRTDYQPNKYFKLLENKDESQPPDEQIVDLGEPVETDAPLVSDDDQKSADIPVEEVVSGEIIEHDLKENIPWETTTSFGFDNTPLKDALRILAKTHDLNIVIGSEVKGIVTMDLRNVSLRQALDNLVYPNNCEYVVDNDIVSINVVETTYKGGSVTRVFRLKYAEAQNIAEIVKQIVSNDSLVKVYHNDFLNVNSKEQRIKYNKVAVAGIHRSSTIVVTDRPEKIREVERVIMELDKPPVQIVIESKLVEMAPTEANTIGINWDKTLTMALKWQDPLGSTQSSSSSSSGQTDNYSIINEHPDKGGEWQMGRLSASQFSAVLDFLQTKTDSKLISNPNLLAMDNEESSISVGTTVPVPRITRGMGGQGDMVTFDYKEINVQLMVTPHSMENDVITMFVNPVIEEITGWVEVGQNRAPITDKRQVNSIVSVKDGETVVLGGLIKSQRQKTIKKVWLLGSLPLLGKLFQHEEYEDVQINLMIFITPKIIRPR